MGDAPRIDIDMENVQEQVRIVFPRPAQIDLAGVAKAVERSGHRLQAMEADLSGRLVPTSSGVRLLLDATGQPWSFDASAPGAAPVPSEGAPWKGRVEVQGWQDPGAVRLRPREP